MTSPSNRQDESNNLKMKAPPPKNQPPPPVFSPPVASYRSARREELDALRQKGLAKIFNRHFTSVADKIRQEREAAELALQEIIKRKEELATNPKSFREGGLTLTQLDKLHMELKKRKSEVQRKERETQELYKRYCSQYGGDNEFSFADVALWKKATNGLSAVYEGTEEGVNHEDMVRQSDIARAKAVDVAHAAQFSNVNQLACDIEEHQQGSATDKKWVGGSFGPKDASYGFSGQQQGMTLSPPPASASSCAPPDAVAPSTKITPTKGRVHKQHPQQKHQKGPLKLNESGLDATAASTPSPVESPSVQDNQDNASVMNRSLYFGNLVDTDDASVVSGLTDIDCATVAEAEWKLTEFLRTETENIKKMLRNEPLDLEVVEEDDNYSIFTYNRSLVSGESDRVGRAAREAEEMVARMAEATAWMNDPTLLENDNESDVEDEEVDDVGKGDSARAEWAAYWSDDHQREYYYNFVTHQTCWTKPLNVEIDYSHVDSLKKTSSASTASSNHGSVHFHRNVSTISPTKTVQSVITKIDSPPSDEKVAVKDFTAANKNSKTDPSPKALSVSKYTNNHAIKSLRPNDSDENSLRVSAVSSPATSSVTSLGISSRSSTTTSKVMQYRRKRARIAKRNRRIVFAILFAVVVGIVICYRQREASVPSSSSSLTTPSNSSIDATKKLELAKKLAAAELERKRLLEQKRHEEEAEQRRMAEEKAAAEAIRKAEEKAMRKKQEEMTLEEQKQKAEEEKKRQEAMQVMLREEEERKQLQLMHEEMRRPWACNIPLTYLMSRKCWKVAKINPIYDCKAIIDAMME
eukprot:CAMPEP_0176504926 /NCGR_PEP_ID=MMETSP0200_2-20121128/16214_1 /TAXON_ID=947934 /ORGANISM="Chaetoceros sp., Strain GSL56" /LENGTH=809 /DNA_ID=CAMNT_0017904431 /DNA_START=88 /DNA_END=2517 /DNA_ORIENTATION=+